MKTITQLLITAVISVFLNSCSPTLDSDDDSLTPPAPYTCDGGRKAYLENNIAGTIHATAAGEDAAGGTAVVTEDGTEYTLVDIGFSNNGVYHLTVKLKGVISTGTYMYPRGDDDERYYVLVNNAGYKVKSGTITYDELTNRRDNPLAPDVDFYDKSSGTFSGVYEDIDGNDVSFSGKFCADLAPR